MRIAALCFVGARKFRQIAHAIKHALNTYNKHLTRSGI